MLKGLLAIAAACLLLLPCAALASSGSAMTRGEASLLRAMNGARARAGLGPLRYDAHLEAAARFHSREMLRANRFEHGAFGSRMARYDIRGVIAGENLAWGSGSLGTAEGIVAAWLASPEHRANLLRSSFRRVGVGSLDGPFLGDPSARVVTADFAG